MSVTSHNNFPQHVRESCANFKSSLVSINPDGVNKFVDDIDLSVLNDYVVGDVGLSTNRFDKEIDFSSVDEEAGFILVAHAVDFGSGFRHILHEHRNGAGAWVTIRAGLINLGQANPSCEAQWLAALTLEEIKDMFDLKVESLLLLAKYLQEDLNELGRELIERGFKNPGKFIGSIAEHGASYMVEKLVEFFPLTFKDEYVVNSQEVCFYKKAQLVVSEIYMRFYNEQERYNFVDIDNLTAFVDNVVVAMMRQHECIMVNDCTLTERLNSGIYIDKGSEEEVALRASALTATEHIVILLNKKHGNKVVNAQRLCNWLWGGLGKHPENRKYPRHLAPSTSFY